jgi:hypothetical protein
MTLYPDRFIRGISDPNHINRSGKASGAISPYIFHFYVNKNRLDGYYESSIN